MLRSLIASAAAALTLCGCGNAADTAGDSAETAAQTQAQTTAPLTAAGPSQTLVRSTDEGVASAASVVRVDMAPNQGDLTVKLFGAAAGDPAMNGLHTYVAFFAGAAEGWQVYRIGDFLDYRVLSAAPGRIDLEIQESVMNSATGQIDSRTRRAIVGWTPGPDGAPPATVTVTPAQ